MIRMPDGIRGQRFFQKHWEQERPGFVESITVFSGHKDERHDYLLCNNLPTLLWLAQSGTLEFHIWHSRAKWEPDARSKSTDYASSLASLEASVLTHPIVRFDIDPCIIPAGMAGAEPELNIAPSRKEVAFSVASSCRAALEAIVKTPGRLGCVFVPIQCTPITGGEPQPSLGWHLMRAHPRIPDRAKENRQDFALQHERPRQDAQRGIAAASRMPFPHLTGKSKHAPLITTLRRAPGANGRPLSTPERRSKRRRRGKG
jgi:bifunctional non-homologous end joining protein LigD